MPTRRSIVARIGILFVMPALVITALAACASGSQTEVLAVGEEGTAATVEETDARVLSDLGYGVGGAVGLLLDACLPLESDGSARAAVLIIHGGSWMRGDKADEGYGRLCRLFAAHGYAAFSLNYRLAPTDVFPAAIDDVTQAVRWLREPAQVERFDIDPARIAAFGGSAGGNLASLLGTRGTGDLTIDARVAAVIDLSGPSDLTGADSTEAFTAVQLSYLGCSATADCPVGAEASPITHVDPSDPPFFIAHSTAEIIPLAQSEAFARALERAGVLVEFVAVEGSLHSIAMLDESLEQRILDFLARALAAPDAVT